VNLVVLDRDGVINQDSDDYIKSPEEWIPIAGSLEAISRLNHFGFRVVVATNQSGIARGLFGIDTLNAIHQRMRQELDRVGGQVDAIFFCPHGPRDDCHCRKPRPGLLYQIRDRLGIDLADVPVIGDSLRDLQCATTVGARPILVETGKGKRTLASAQEQIPGLPVFPDLSAAAEAIIGYAFRQPRR
jgi:D-glycero-D-manno-heptose 1,7-bisphosphate phosphatase